MADHFYRTWHNRKGLTPFKVTIDQTDMRILAHQNLWGVAVRSATRHRNCLEQYIRQHPQFATTLESHQPEDDAPDIVKGMCIASQLMNVGPMAAVAGAIAEAVGNDLLKFSPEIIVENGGDLFLKILKERLVGIYAGQSAFTGKIALRITPQEGPLGISTSSGTVGHSFSMGTADAVVVISPSATLSDAAATSFGNLVKSAEDIPGVIESAQQFDDIRGVIIIVGDKMGAWGEIEVAPLG